MPFKHAAVFLLFIVIILRIAWVCYEKPLYNWDTLPYMGVLLDVEDDDVNRIYQNTYRIAREEIPANRYKSLVDTLAFKNDLLKNPEKFFQFTSFFRIKPFYTALSYSAYKAGVPLSKAPVIPSIISFVMISLLLVWWFSQFFSGWVAALLSLCVMVSPPLLEAARQATPDALSTLITLIAFYLLLNHSPRGWLIFVLSISIAVHVGNVVLAVVIIFFLIFFPSKSQDAKMPRAALLIPVVLWIAYAIWIMSFANIHNGFDLFYGGVSKKTNLLIVFKEAFIGLNTLQSSHLSIVLAISTVILFYGKPFKLKSLTKHQYLFLIMLTYLAARYFMFPDLSTRFYLPIYIMSIVLSLEAIYSLTRNSVSEKYL